MRLATVLLLGIGLIFLVATAIIGLYGVPAARAEAASFEALRPLGAAALDDSTPGTAVLVTGVISPRNGSVFRNFVAYVREELDVNRTSDDKQDETWRPIGGEVPALLVEAGGMVTVRAQPYAITRGHETWYDERTLVLGQTREGSQRYHGLVAGRALTAFGTVVAGREGNELAATTLFGGTRDEFLETQRGSVTTLVVLASILGGVGALLIILSVGIHVPGMLAARREREHAGTARTR